MLHCVLHSVLHLQDAGSHLLWLLVGFAQHHRCISRRQCNQGVVGFWVCSLNPLTLDITAASVGISALAPSLCGGSLVELHVHVLRGSWVAEHWLTAAFEVHGVCVCLQRLVLWLVL